MPAAGERGYRASNWNQTRAAGVPNLWCLQEERVGVSTPATGADKGLSHQGRTGMYPKIQLLGRTRVSKASQGLGASSWSETVGHKPVLLVPAAGVVTDMLCTCKIQQQT